MMEDNELAVFHFAAREEVAEEIEEAERVEDCADGGAPLRSLEVLMECIRER